MVLRGVLEASFGNILCLRGFAKLGELADISIADESYQRDVDDVHKNEIADFYDSGEYTFFPELILGVSLSALKLSSVDIEGLYRTVATGEARNLRNKGGITIKTFVRRYRDAGFHRLVSAPTKFDEMLEKANRGDTQAQYNVGVMYYSGDGCVKNDQEAYAWFIKAAEQGNADAQFASGLMLTEGRGCVGDDSAAVEFYRKAAVQGNATAQNNLGWMLVVGRGCKVNGEEALYWLHEAEKQGNAYAQESLGGVYEYGKAGIKKNLGEAEKWYRKALENPSADGDMKKAALAGLERIKKARADGNE